MNTLAYMLTSNSLNIILKGRPYSLSSSDEVFADVVALIKQPGTSEDAVLDVLQKAQRALTKATAITPDISISNGMVFYKGQAVENSLCERMLTMLDEGFDLVPMANFLANLLQNPSYRAVKELYPFLEKGKMPITPDGCFMAYKAVRADYKDIHSGTMDNSIGQVVQMPRNAVDDNRDRTCSAGLHFCSFDYLPHFAHANGHVVLLKINPADVVSIPADYNDTKGRACRYEVVGEYADYYTEKRPMFNTSVYDPNRSDDDGDDDGEFDVYGDGCHIESFDNRDDAIDCARNAFDSGEYDGVTVDDPDGDEIFSQDRDDEDEDEENYRVVVDGDEVDSFDDLSDARECAVEHFSKGANEVVVYDYDNDEVIRMDS